MQDIRKKGILTLEDGGLAQRRRFAGSRTVPADTWLEREMVSAFAAIHGEDGTVPSKGIYNIRSLDHRPWRALAKRLSEAKEAGAPREQVEGVLKVFAVWLDELYAPTPKRAA